MDNDMEEKSIQTEPYEVNPKEKTSQIILLAGALFLGILFNCLFFDSELGISIPIFVIAFYGVLLFSMRETTKFKFDLSWALSIPVLLLSLTYMFFSNNVFYILNIMAIPLLIVVQTVLITGNYSFSWHTPGFLIDIIYGFFYRTFANIARPFKLIAAFSQKSNKSNSNHNFRKVLLGLLISIPLLLIVVSLLISADQVFKSYMDRIPNVFSGIKLDEYFARGFIILFIFFTSFSYIFSLKERKKPEMTGLGDGSIKLPKVWDRVVVITVMLLVNAIYLMFVLIQFAYLFGGVRFDSSQNFTYSEYARRGFFELITVTIINFGILMLCIGFTKMNTSASARFIRILYSLLVGCTLVILVSAYYRMLLYEEAYGFTYLRVLTQAFMIFLLVLFGILLLKIWKEKISLAKPFIITAVAAFVIINYVNIDVIIARNNIERYHTTHKIDVEYLSTLSFDAIPEVAKLAKTEDEKVSTEIVALLNRKKKEASRFQEWQSFNVSRYKAGQWLK